MNPQFRPFEYMRWAKEHTFGHRYHLGGSAVPAPQTRDVVQSREDLSINVHPFYGVPRLRELIAARGNHFGELNDLPLRVAPEEVVVTEGSSLFNYLLITLLCGPSAPLVCEMPAYEAFERIAEAAGASVSLYERPGARCEPRDPAQRFRVDLAALDHAWTAAPGARLAVVTNLHNPTGRALDRTTLEGLNRLAAKYDGYVLVDEVYLEMSPDDVVLPSACVGERLIACNSFTKCYGLGNIRLGWGIVHDPQVRQRLHDMMDIMAVDVSILAQQFAIAFFRGLDERRTANRMMLARNLQALKVWLSECPDVELIPPDGGACVTLRLYDEMDSMQAVERCMNDFDTVIVPGEVFNLPGHLRVGIGQADPMELREGLNHLATVLNDMSSSR